MRNQTGSGLPLGFSGELTDPTTGFLDLRARDLDAALGRFLSRDTISPNAPGSQGFNLYAYAANNPTTWADLSGHSVGSAVNGLASLVAGCFAYLPCSGLLQEQLALAALAVTSGNWILGLGAAVGTVFVLVWCALTEPCMQASQDIQLIAKTYGGGVDTGGGNRPPSPASCVWDAVKGWTTGVGDPADGVHTCAEAIRASVAPPTQSVPVIEIPACRWPEATQHVQDAQAQGYPSVLTIDRTGRSARNRAALAGYPTIANYDRDEYPPAMFKEGGAGASVRYISPSDNRGLGSYIDKLTRKYPNGTAVQLKVVPCD